MSQLSRKNLEDSVINLVKMDPLILAPVDDELTEEVAKVATVGADGKIFLNQLPDQVANNTVGSPTDGSYTGGLLEITPTTKIADATDGINLILAKLAPPKPANLSTKTISLSTSYSALEAGTGTSHPVLTDATQPQINEVTSFYDGDAGDLSAFVDGVESKKTLGIVNDSGTTGSLVITADTDPYSGQAGKANFWKALSAYIKPASALGLGLHTFKMKHSTTGETNQLSFYVDNPQTVTISNAAITLPVTGARYISGVPGLNVADSILAAFRVSSAVGTHYHPSKVASVSGAQVSTADVGPTKVYDPNENFDLSGISVAVGSNAYAENIALTLRGYNSKAVAGSLSVNTGARVDTASSEASRLTSGSSADYPTTGVGNAFTSATSLMEGNAHELQMLNGLYQYPTGNYTGNLPVAGPNYTGATGTRWVTFSPQSLTAASAFTLNFVGAVNFGSTAVVAGLQVYAKVEGATGWINCNASYSGVGSPTADGTPAMVLGFPSTAILKRVTFGSTTRTGRLLIRVGLPEGSTKKFSNITITAVS